MPRHLLDGRPNGFVVKRLKRGQPLTAAHEVFRGTKDDGGYGVRPAVLRDAAGHQGQPHPM